MAQHGGDPTTARLFLLHQHQRLPARRHVMCHQRRTQRLQGYALGPVDDLRRKLFVCKVGDERGELPAQRHGSFLLQRAVGPRLALGAYSDNHRL